MQLFPNPPSRPPREREPEAIMNSCIMAWVHPSWHESNWLRHSCRAKYRCLRAGSALWQLLTLEVVTKRGFLAKNDTRRRAVSKYDAWAMHPPKYDTRPVCSTKYDTRPVCSTKYDTRPVCSTKYDTMRPHSQKARRGSRGDGWVTNAEAVEYRPTWCTGDTGHV